MAGLQLAVLLGPGLDQPAEQGQLGTVLADALLGGCLELPLFELCLQLG
jgi:hypothetical protein